MPIQWPAIPHGQRLLEVIASLLVVVIVVLMLCLIIIVATKDKHRKNQCHLSRTMPDIDALMQDKRNIADEYGTGLANLVGYLHFYNRGFLPIVLKELHVGPSTVRLETDCANLLLSYQLVDDSHNNQTRLHDMALKLVGQSEENCYFRAHQDIYFLRRQRYSCLRTVQSVCSQLDAGDYYKPTIELVLGSFELELFGSHQSIAAGAFDLPIDGSNCRTWRG